METFPVDIDPGQIVRWVMTENKDEPARFRFFARRSAEAREIPVRIEFRLGDEEREDLSEIATIASLEIAPAHAGDGWLLTVVVEDELGPRIIDDRKTEEIEEEIDLETFYTEFIRPGRGNASVVAEVDSSVAKTRIARLLAAMERNRHGPDQVRPKQPGG